MMITKTIDPPYGKATPDITDIKEKAAMKGGKHRKNNRIIGKARNKYIYL